jgi:predicted HTH domain antitoxin
MSVRISLEVPEGAFSILRIKPEDFAREILIAAAVKWYEMELLSQSKAAELAGLSRQDFLKALHRFGVSPFQVTIKELEREMVDVRKLRKRP